MREYTVQGQNLTVIAGATLVFINPGASRVIEIVRAWAGVEGVSSAQATTGIQLSLKATAFPTLVSATPQKTKTSDPASAITGGTAGAAGTSGVNASAEGAGAVTLLYPDTMNLQIPWIWNPSILGGETYIVSGADALGFQLKLRGTPAVLTGWNFGVTYRELG